MEHTQNKKTILIVEDDPPELTALTDQFTLEGFHVVHANNGEDGLKMAESAHPDLILLDILMPKMDGLAMKNILREKNEWGKTVPIFLVTNLSSDEDIIVKSLAKDESTYCLVKADWSIYDIVKKAKERLGDS